MKVINLNIAALVTALALVGCGGDNDGGSNNGSSSSSSSSGSSSTSSTSSSSTSTSSTSSSSTSSSSTSSTSSTSSSSSSTSSGGEAPRYIKLFEDNFESGNLSKWESVSISSNKDWVIESYAGDKFAVGNCYQADAACDDWLISPSLDLSNFESTNISFNNAWNYGSNSLSQMKLKVSVDYTGDPSTATWTDISDSVNWSEGAFEFVASGNVSLSEFVGNDVVVAFHYAALVAEAAKWEIDDVVIDGMGIGDFPLDAEIVIPDTTSYAGRSINFSASAFNGAGEPYAFSWDFGDSSVLSEGNELSHIYSAAGQYEVTLTVTDSAQSSVSISKFVTVETQSAFALPEKTGDFRVATFNAGFDPFVVAGGLKAEFDKGDYIKAKKVAEIIQRTNADVLLLNEIDGNDNAATINSFNEHYLKVAQNGAAAIEYSYIYTNDCNTGVPSGFDLNNDGSSNTADDAYGFGEYPGKYCMAVFSKYPLDEDNARTFQLFKWKDMPGALKPVSNGEEFYSAEEWDVFRLSSKTHLDIPVTIDGKVVHILGSHPTPPTFDAEEDRNGKRNADEIRLWADYIDPDAGDYLYDDNNNSGVSLNEGDMFIILGDENASRVEGDAYVFEDNSRAIDQLLESPYVNPNLREDSVNFQVPTSVGGADNDPSNVYATTHTAGWQMRADYVLPSSTGMRIKQNGVFWPRHSDDLHYLVEAVDANDIESSDHRLVWMDLEFFDGVVVDPETGNDQNVLEDDFSDANLAGWTVVDKSNADINWEQGSFNTDSFAKANCYNGAEPCDEWMLREVNLAGVVNPVLTFRNAYKYGNNPLDQISVLVATDFTGDVDVASWNDLSDEANWSTGNFAWADSGELDLSAYANASITLAFRYQASNASGEPATWEITSVVVGEASESEGDGKGGTVLSDTAPGDILNQTNKRQTGVLVFNGINAPVNAEEEGKVLASNGATLNGNPIAGFGYTTLAKSGQLVDGNVYAQVNDKFGTPLFVSNYNEFTSFITRGERLFAISQYENIPGGMSLSELGQGPTTGQLTMVTTQSIDFSEVHGGYNHCAAMVTPWDTHLGSEEYEPDYRLRSDVTGEIDTYYNQIADYHSDLPLTQVNPYWYGFAVEVDVDVSETDEISNAVTKHYAMGRLAIELAYAMPDERTVYLTDDGTNGGLFIFIADVPTDLSAGNLYAMKWNQTENNTSENAGMGAADIEWIAMGHATSDQVFALIDGENAVTFSDIFDVVEPANNQCMLGYTSINHKGVQECLKLKPGMALAASRLETRRYAAYLGATVEMRKEEGITYNPHNHKMYLAISDIDNGMLAENSADVGGKDHVKISTRNDCGGLYEMSLGSNAAIGSDYVVGAMKGLISGEPEGDYCALDNIAGPDNVAYIGYDTLIITEDTDDHANNFVWAYDLNAKILTRIFSAPSGAENTGPYMFNNMNGFSYISTVVQHPAGESVDPSPGNEAEIGYFGPIPAMP